VRRFELRLQRLRRVLEAGRLDAIIITQPENRRYLSGFTGSAGTLFITHDQEILIADSRYAEQSAKEAPQYQVVKAEPRVLPNVLSDLAAKAGARSVAFESHHLAFSDYRDWAGRADDFELVPCRELVEDMRALKDEQELATIRKAAALGDAAFAHTRRTIMPGMTEKEVAWDLEVHMRTHGADGVGFDIIVAAGPNAAMPHATVSGDRIQVGQPIIIDVGARCDGYRSDLTRTLCLGEPDDKFEEIYHLVLEAQLAAEEGIKPGMSAREADALARDVIAGAGYGEYFGHGLGHGVGLAVHEKPKADRASHDILYPGMTLTIEPGIYVPGWGGVRLEDLTVIGEEGVEVLSRADKDPSITIG
jgi:Xaa-Pro aminopeptidase